MSDCIDQNIGKLLHEYELGTLSEEDTDLFGEHLMECEYCLNEAKSFGKYATVIRQSATIEKLIKLPGEGRSDTVMKRLWRHVWPETSFVFRPGILYILILLMTIPTYLGLKNIFGGNSGIRPVQTINLTSTRTAQNNVLTISSGLDGVIRFEIPEAILGESYQVILTTEGGKEITRHDDFPDINELKVGEFIFPNHLMEPGNYRLIITDLSEKDALDKIYEYRFRIGQ